MSSARTIPIRAAANRWISETFPDRRRFISHSVPIMHGDGWLVRLLARHESGQEHLGDLFIGSDKRVALLDIPSREIEKRIVEFLDRTGKAKTRRPAKRVRGKYHDFRLGDGIRGAGVLEDLSVDLLLTDPPYGISAPYTCEKQVPRRIRRVYTDKVTAYKGIGRPHESVEHSVGEYVVEQAQMDGLEPFRSMLRRDHDGSLHHISLKHLGHYMKEFAGRCNDRDADTLDMAIAGMVGKRLMYSQFTAEAA